MLLLSSLCVSRYGHLGASVPVVVSAVELVLMYFYLLLLFRSWSIIYYCLSDGDTPPNAAEMCVEILYLSERQP